MKCLRIVNGSVQHIDIVVGDVSKVKPMQMLCDGFTRKQVQNRC